MLWKSIIAAIVVIFGSTFLAYKLSLFWGISVEQRTWVLCVLMAIVCSLVAAPSTMYFPVSHLSVIAFAVIASTIFITYYNYRQTHKKYTSKGTREKRKLEPMPARPLRGVRQPLKLPERTLAALKVDELPDLSPQPAEEIKSGVFATLFAATPEAQEKSLDTLVAAALKEDEKKLSSPQQMAPQKMPVSLSNPLPSEKEPKKAKEQAIKAKKEREESFLQKAPRLSFYGFFYHLSPREKEICKSTIAGKSLDEIVGAAYEYWRQRKLYQALYCLFAALDCYGDDSAALFICIEISNIYKSFGAYELAAASLLASLYLPVVRENAALQRDLKEQIAYLHRLIAVLNLAGMPQIPIERVPGAFLRRADVSSSSEEDAAQDSSMEAI